MTTPAPQHCSLEKPVASLAKLQTPGGGGATDNSGDTSRQNGHRNVEWLRPENKEEHASFLTQEEQRGCWQQGGMQERLERENSSQQM